jgi:hypothetical protein
MSNAWKKVAFVLPLAMSLSAFDSVATVTSDDPFTLDGRSLAVTGVNSWPLVLGDEIDTLGSPVVLILQNGTKIQVSAHSKVKLTGSSTRPNVTVESGKIMPLGSAPIKNGSASAHPLVSGGGPGPHHGISSFQ